MFALGCLGDIDSGCIGQPYSGSLFLLLPLPLPLSAVFYRDPCIIPLNIALYMVVDLYFGGKKHVSEEQNVSFKEPCYMRQVCLTAIYLNEHWPPTKGEALSPLGYENMVQKPKAVARTT